MSLNQIFSTATSGLAASQAALRTISNNVANVNTPGYARERIELEALVAGGKGSGVRVSSLERITNRFLEAAAYAAHGDAGRSDAQQSYLDRLIAQFGEPGSASSLAGRLDALAASAVGLTADAGDLAARRVFLDRAYAALSELQRIGGETVTLRAEAESEIATNVTRINVLLKRIETLSGSITAAGFAGGSTAALAGQRSQALSELGALIAIDVREQPGGGVDVTTRSGIALVDQRARQLAYTSPPAVAGLAIYPPIEIVRVDSRGNPEPTGEVLTLANSGGRVGGLLELRDRSLPATHAELANLFIDLAGSLNAAHNASSAVPAPASLDGRNTGLAASDRAGLAGRTVFAVTAADGNIIARTTIDFTALGAGASVADAVAAINAGLGGAATASFANGRMQITAASPSNGVVVANDPSSPAMRAGLGFSDFFGLNDLVAGVPRGSGLVSTDPHGFATGETAAFQLRDVTGKVIASATLSPASGGTVGDLLSVLNASAISGFGSFVLSSQGNIAFQPNAGAVGANVALISDSTSRLGTGVSLGQLFQIPPSSNAALAGAHVRADLMGDSRRLSLATFNSVAAIGQQGLFAADASGAEALAVALTVGINLSARTGDLVGRVGAESARAAENAADANARRSDAITRRDDFSGVNLDEELALMIVFQNSYSASARLMTTAREMYDILLQLGR